MAGRGNLSALALINDIKQHELDMIGVELSALRAQQDDFARQRQALSDSAARESAESTSDMRVYLHAYLSSVDRQSQGLLVESDKLSAQIEVLEEKLFDTFRESKTTRTVLARAQANVDLEAQRAEYAELDDVSRAMSFQKGALF
ncbi:MAG TPA: flagellar motor protein [Roseobacter sp.]|nr:flagellar motor protein [Roseobacter sp.]|tara:strand:+ start:4673 stop:5107 length:435 start_codon:yes stop_codon:yes gene_type:complete